jgi:hypothetical protein
MRDAWEYLEIAPVAEPPPPPALHVNMPEAFWAASRGVSWNDALTRGVRAIEEGYCPLDGILKGGRAAWHPFLQVGCWTLTGLGPEVLSSVERLVKQRDEPGSLLVFSIIRAFSSILDEAWLPGGRCRTDRRRRVPGNVIALPWVAA